MIERYQRPEMTAIWNDQKKYSLWLEIEILVTKARAERGEVPAEDLAELQAKAAFDVERIADLERKTRHDVAAFVDNVAENVGPAARHLHYGMTSSDVLDTALALQLKEASELLLTALDSCISRSVELARRYARTPMAARTHGIHAEPTTFGVKVAGWAFEMHRGRARLLNARKIISVGKISGVVGTYSQLPPEIERFVCNELGLSPDPASTQVVSRDRHAEFVAACAVLAGTLERIATELRHLARTEVGEVEEAFEEGEQKGSSAMPHKKNPVRLERITGLARFVRGAVVPALENIALWHERDIAHSSAERIILPDVSHALYFMLLETASVLSSLKVFPERMKTNLDLSYGLVFSQRIMHDLIDAGTSRDEAYRVLQEAAMEAQRTKTHLRDLLSANSEVASRLSPAQIERSFSVVRYLEHADEIVGRLEKIDPSRRVREG